MILLTALGPLADIKAAADELDRHDPSPADAVSWFEESPGKFRLEVYVPTKQDAASAEAIVGAAAQRNCNPNCASACANAATCAARDA